ncbi:pre-rRNA-processing protein TSR1 [Nematocida homosporus]|uniref:pre-rRNA-processing protein TSR1 n=1 Tax=Nematocida homosporus TaxID=1912981 RepID=UPI00221EFF36|nr:pre-rRNA-processing protein TSR1 [Nematocida homosporus]KAI5186726.1 pre-rRNA-processing protein TSR1 [Nematocida homosporus]
MARHLKQTGLSQKERVGIGLVTSVVVTSLGTKVLADDIMPSIIASIKNSYKLDVQPQKILLGERVSTRKASFSFFGNSSTDIAIMKMRILAADLNIVVLDSEIDKQVEEVLKTARQGNLLFLSYTKTVSSDLKKYAKSVFGKSKVYTLADIGRVLEAKTVVNQKKAGRPNLVADSIEVLSDTAVKITGYVEKGFTSFNVLMNGTLPGKIVQITAPNGPVCLKSLKTLTKDQIYGPSLSPAENKFISLVEQVRITDQPMEYSDDSLGAIQMDESEENHPESNEEESSDSINSSEYQADYAEDQLNPAADSEEESSDLLPYEPMETNTDEISALTNRYRGFKGFQTINLGMHKNAKDNSQLKLFRMQNLPEYYKDLSFVSSERARKKILAKPSPVPVRVPLEIVVEVEGGWNALQRVIADGFLNLFGLFDYEGLPTIVTLEFSSQANITPEMAGTVVFDYGFALAKPTNIAIGSGTEIIKCRREGNSGTLCFVGPLILTESKIHLIHHNAFFGAGVQSLRKDPILIKTVVFKGLPVKIRKRSCVVGRMFKTRDEVLYFRHIKIYSSERKEGRIKRPLGQHGLMKCYFCPPVKHGEKIYMELARRVFLSHSPLLTQPNP